jgi:hypothetical protein
MIVKLRVISDMSAVKQPQLPKDALTKVILGQSFAEYDLLRKNVDALYVKTPALEAALNEESAKCFFVGRRGTGKTALTYYLTNKQKNTLQIVPQIFDLLKLPANKNIVDFMDTRQKPFRSLLYCFKRALLGEVAHNWYKTKSLKYSEKYPNLNKERNFFEDFDFDERILKFAEDIFEALNSPSDREWVKQIKRVEHLNNEMNDISESGASKYRLLIDRIDDSWSGTEESVIQLMALMHACVDITANSSFLRTHLFLRENIFERVRSLDNEFARIETAVVPMDWTRIQLLEMIERRLNKPFISKFPLGGPTWDCFFEDGNISAQEIFDSCQERPRDVLTYCELALQSARTRKHTKITIQDIKEARKQFSESRLKDLGDEYSENYPHIQIILKLFYGLGNEFTIDGIESFIQKILVNNEVKTFCHKWVYKFTAPELFIDLLYSIGFWGIRDKSGNIHYRSQGPKSSTINTATDRATQVVIHPSYLEALNLQEVVIRKIEDTFELKDSGLVDDLPDESTMESYKARLEQVMDNLKTLPTGTKSAAEFEGVIGEIIRLCFFRSLTNIQEKVRDYEGRVIRDWIVANRAKEGFWEMIRQKYSATQVIWECKNYTDLKAEDFHQASYYMNKESGYFSIIVFRGEEKKKFYWEHIKRISNQNKGLVLLLSQKDLLVFIRQALNGKIKEEHIHDIFDMTERQIS